MDHPLLRRQRRPLRQLVIFLGIAIVLVVVLVFLMSLNAPAGGPQ